MPYLIYERQYWDERRAAELGRKALYGRLATALILIGLLSLGTAYAFSVEMETTLQDKIGSPDFVLLTEPQRGDAPPQINGDSAIAAGNGLDSPITNKTGPAAKPGRTRIVLAGPFTVDKYKAVYSVEIKLAGLPDNSWAYVEGELLDENQNYLFSFGRELWRESGVDGGEAWSESALRHEVKFTIPKPGRYYINLTLDQSGAFNEARPSVVELKISRRLGSSLPHLVFGIICLGFGLLFSELCHGIIRSFSSLFSDDD
ncbi:hypothetical protein LJB99_04815 [Deltaproteobacteria bacterium OttesenSCG-928-K17]|nr:hypothetical protein [Deltaproteobacteria bacterium OttesenSCG-928-K17]